MKKIIYLCGPVQDCSDSECQTWRTETKNFLELVHGFKCYNPMDRDFRGSIYDEKNIHEIVELDKFYIDQSNMLLVYYNKVSVGTSMEILYAWERQKPVLVVVPDDSISLSPWLKYHSTKIFKNLKEAYEFIALL